jgi:hypothetical protein
MHIDEVQFPVEPAWEADLVRPTGVFAPHGEGMPHVGLGKPMWWPDQALMGKDWTPSAGKRFGLARFALALRAAERQEVRYVEFVVYLHGTGPGTGLRPIATDLFPGVLTEDKLGLRTAGLGPEFQFIDLSTSDEATRASAATTIQLRQAVQVVVADGVGESTTRWVFAGNPAHPLVGTQLVYAAVEVLPDASGLPRARASLQLIAEVETRSGAVRGLLPKTERAMMNWVLE